MAITLETAQAQLDAWIAADAAVSKGQAYEIAGRKMTRADAAAITEKIDYWNRWVNRLSRGGRGARVRYATGPSQ